MRTGSAAAAEPRGTNPTHELARRNDPRPLLDDDVEPRRGYVVVVVVVAQAALERQRGYKGVKFRV